MSPRARKPSAAAEDFGPSGFVGCDPLCTASKACEPRIGDRVHYTSQNGDGPWHGVIISLTGGVYSLEVIKPNGHHHVIVAAMGDEPGQFVIVT